MIMCGLLGITVYWAGDLLLDAVWEPLSAWSWILAPVAMLLFLLWRSRLAFQAHPAQPGRKALLVIGLANSVTLCRGLLICGLGGFASSPQLQGVLAWVPCIIYASLFAADGLDGLIARACGEDSPAGEVLDHEVDALGVFIAAIVAYQYGRLPAFYVPVGAAYYIFNLAIWLRMKHGKPVYHLRPSRFRRSIGTLQGFSLTLLLAPLINPAGGFWLAVVLTLAVSLSFVKDWMAVIGAHWRLRRRSGA
jgi:CDP-diacylglycerol--glycerol-3-phosphate 3-phosphatidyltransferase